MQNFIRSIFISEIKQLEAQDQPMTRLQNIIWPSESTATTGPFSAGECKRSLFYKYVGVQASNPPSLRSRYICDAGKMYENIQMQRFKQQGLLVDDQCKLEFKLPNTKNNIVHSGKIDAILKYGNTKKGIEIKSISGFMQDDVFGKDEKIGLPSPSNLMQAMLYKYACSQTEENKSKEIDEIYLMYVSRNDGMSCYYKIDLDGQGYAIITPISQTGVESKPIRVADNPSYEDFISGKVVATDELSRIAELRFSVYDIFSKFDEVYDHKNHMELPAKDYDLIYDRKTLEMQLACGRISKRKYNAHIKGIQECGDFKCAYCNYQKKCLEDSGVHFK